MTSFAAGGGVGFFTSTIIPRTIRSLPPSPVSRDNLVILEREDPADDAALGDDRVALLHAGKHGLVLLHPVVLRTDQQEVEDHDHADRQH